LSDDAGQPHHADLEYGQRSDAERLDETACERISLAEPRLQAPPCQVDIREQGRCDDDSQLPLDVRQQPERSTPPRLDGPVTDRTVEYPLLHPTPFRSGPVVSTQMRRENNDSGHLRHILSAWGRTSGRDSAASAPLSPLWPQQLEHAFRGRSGGRPATPHLSSLWTPVRIGREPVAQLILVAVSS
jgi:hypothetical protein